MSETTTNRTNQSATTATLAGYEIPRLGMGTMALAIEGRPSNRDQAIETIHAALDAGVRYLDTAWSYYLPSAPGTGEPEDMGYGEYLVRDALHSWHGPKDQVLVATKTGWLRTLDGNGNYGWQADARPETMIANAKESAPPSVSIRSICSTRTATIRRCRTKTRWAHSSSSWTKVWPKLSASPESTTRTSKPPTIFGRSSRGRPEPVLPGPPRP